jgi:hypothetical protein
LFKHKFKADRDAKSASYNIILGCNAMKELEFNLLYSENIPKILFDSLSKKSKLIASLVMSVPSPSILQAQQPTIDKPEEEFFEK